MHCTAMCTLASDVVLENKAIWGQKKSRFRQTSLRLDLCPEANLSVGTGLDKTSYSTDCSLEKLVGKVKVVPWLTALSTETQCSSPSQSPEPAVSANTTQLHGR